MSLHSALLSRLAQAKSRKGFTLIELLVVIAIIGILAVAVLATINPIEQINKGNDTRDRADATQLLQAVERYYTNNELYPWNVTQGTYTSGNVSPTAAFNYSFVTGTTDGWLEPLRTSSEVKDNFISRVTGGNKLVVIKIFGDNSPTYVCFTPRSNAFKAQADTYYTNNGTAVAAINNVITNTFRAPAAGVINPICVP